MAPGHSPWGVSTTQELKKSQLLENHQIVSCFGGSQTKCICLLPRKNSGPTSVCGRLLVMRLSAVLRDNNGVVFPPPKLKFRNDQNMKCQGKFRGNKSPGWHDFLATKSDGLLPLEIWVWEVTDFFVTPRVFSQRGLQNSGSWRLLRLSCCAFHVGT